MKGVVYTFFRFDSFLFLISKNKLEGTEYDEKIKENDRIYAG